MARILTKSIPCEEIPCIGMSKLLGLCRTLRIYVEIGRIGVFDLKPYLDPGVFRELRDVHYFNQVGILFGAVTWPHEQDIAPETLLAEMVSLDPYLAPDELLKSDPGGVTRPSSI